MSNDAAEVEKADLDALLEPLGGFGKFQAMNILQITVIFMLAGITEIAYVFTAAGVKHRCFIPECETLNSSYDQPWLSSALPLSAEGEFTFCERYKSASNAHHPCGNKSFTDEKFQCDSFIYETNEKTIVREDWGISCESDRWMLTLIGSLNNAGIVIGSMFIGFLCDRYGRKTAIVTMSIVVAILGTIKSFAINYAMFAAFELIEAIMEGGLFTLPFLFAVEIVDPGRRVHAGAAVSCGYPLGEIIVGCVQWLTLDWRVTLKIVRIPFLIIIVYYWTLPESVRWLITKNRQHDALDVLQKIAKTNGTILSEEAVEVVLKHVETAKNPGTHDRSELKSMIHSRILRLRLFATLFIWIANTFVFFGMNLNSVSINEDKFVNSVLTSLTEIPAYLSIIFLHSRLGRKKTQSGSLFLCSAGCLCFAFAPDLYWARLLLYLIGKLGIAISFITVDVYTAELFPTSVRASAMSTGHMVGRIAAVLAPQTPLLAVFYKQLPLILFSILAAIGGTLALTLPETLNIKLPDTVREAENLGRHKKRESKTVEKKGFENF